MIRLIYYGKIYEISKIKINSAKKIFAELIFANKHFKIISGKKCLRIEKYWYFLQNSRKSLAKVSFLKASFINDQHHKSNSNYFIIVGTHGLRPESGSRPRQLRTSMLKRLTRVRDLNMVKVLFLFNLPNNKTTILE